MEPFIHRPPPHCVLDYCPFSSAPKAAAHLSCHTGSEGWAFLRIAYSESSPSPSREGQKCKAFLPALGSFQIIWGFGPHSLEPVGASRKSSAVDQPPGEGGSGLAAAVAAPVASSGHQERAGEGKGLTKGRNLMWHLKVSFGTSLEAHVIFRLITPFYRDHLEDYFSSWVSGVLPYHPLWPAGPSVPSSPAWWVSSALCLALDAVSVMLAKEAEDMRDRSRLLGLSFLPLHHPGLRGAWTAPTSESLRRLQSCRPAPGHWAMHCVILGAIFPCRAGSLGSAHPLWVDGWAPKQHKPLFPQPPPPKGRDFLSGLFVLKQSGVK